MGMKIQRPTAIGVGDAYQVGTARPAVQPNTADAAPVARGDSVSVSHRAQEAGRLRAKLTEAPEIRAELVQRIKAQVEAGTYTVSSTLVAERLLKSKVLDT